MTTATTSTFDQTADEICTDALINVGACGPGRTPAAGQLTHARRALNRLVKSIDADGGFLWRIVRRSVVAGTVLGTASYTLPTDVIAVDEPANYRRAGQNARTEIRAMSRDDYMVKPDRTTQGVPMQYLTERTLSGMTMTLWPVPDATGDDIEYAAVLRAKDFTTGAETADFDQKFIVCLVLGLSAMLAPVYGQDGSSWDEKFATERDRQLNADNEGGNMTLVPFGWNAY